MQNKHIFIQKTKSFLKTCLFILIVMPLSCCRSSLWDRSPPPSPTKTGFFMGVAGGAAIGGAVSAGMAIPLGAALGSMWAGAVGNVIQSHQTLVEDLMYHGVQIIRVGDDIRIILPADRFFYSNSANLNPTYTPTLKNVMIFIRAFAKVDVKIAAYTDNEGSWQKNLALSRLQAKQIAEVLWRGHIDARMVLAQGYGEASPIANNDTISGKAENRRVEITFRKIEPDVLI